VVAFFADHPQFLGATTILTQGEGALSQHQLLTETHSSQVYATDLDEFVDFHAWQSVNVNPSTEQGVHP